MLILSVAETQPTKSDSLAHDWSAVGAMSSEHDTRRVAARWAVLLPTRLLCHAWSYVDVCMSRSVCKNWNVPAHCPAFGRMMRLRFLADWTPHADTEEAAVRCIAEPDSTWLARHMVRSQTLVNLRRGAVCSESLVASLDWSPGRYGIPSPVNADWGAGGGRYLVLQADDSPKYRAPYDVMLIDLTTGSCQMSRFCGDREPKERAGDANGVDRPCVLTVSGTTMFTCRRDLGEERRVEHEYVDQWSLPDMKHLRRLGPFGVDPNARWVRVDGAAVVDDRLVVWVLWVVSSLPMTYSFLTYDLRTGNLVERSRCSTGSWQTRLHTAMHQRNVCTALCLLSSARARETFLTSDDPNRTQWSVAAAPDTRHLVVAELDELHVWCADRGTRLSRLNMGCEGPYKEAFVRFVMVSRPPASQPDQTFVVWCCRCKKHCLGITVLRLSRSGSLQWLYERRVAKKGCDSLLCDALGHLLRRGRVRTPSFVVRSRCKVIPSSLSN